MTSIIVVVNKNVEFYIFLLARGSIFLPFDSATARARNKYAAFMSAGIACFDAF
jgi:hypothetical protein